MDDLRRYGRLDVRPHIAQALASRSGIRFELSIEDVKAPILSPSRFGFQHDFNPRLRERLGEIFLYDMDMFGHFGEFAYRHGDVPHVRVVLINKCSKSYANDAPTRLVPDVAGRLADAPSHQRVE